jgi:hypothetical protein
MDVRLLDGWHSTWLPASTVHVFSIRLRSAIAFLTVDAIE